MRASFILCAAFLVGMLLPCLPGCTGSVAQCGSDGDCSPGFTCQGGICYAQSDSGFEFDSGGDPGADHPSDPGADHGDSGGDPGTDPGPSDPGVDSGADPGPPWQIQPGTGIGSLRVSTSMASGHTLGEVQQQLSDSGSPVSGVTYSLSFLNDTLWVGGIDINSSKTFDSADHVISLEARTGLWARTAEGLGPGSTITSVHAVGAYSSPDHTAYLPASGTFPGGVIESYFQVGLFVGYDNQNVSNAFTVTRSYQQPPNARIDPANATLAFGGTVISCGDGINTGSTRDVHRGVLGEPDWASGFDQTVQGTTVHFYDDSYRNEGMDFVGGDDQIGMYTIDKLVLVGLYPLFYGTTASGHGLYSSKSDWEQELGAPTGSKTDATYNVTVYIYTAGSGQFGIAYTNSGASQTDTAVLLVLNYPKQ